MFDKLTLPTLHPVKNTICCFIFHDISPPIHLIPSAEKKIDLPPKFGPQLCVNPFLFKPPWWHHQGNGRDFYADCNAPMRRRSSSGSEARLLSGPQRSRSPWFTRAWSFPEENIWTGWWFGCHFLNFPINIGNNHPNWLSYVSEGWFKPPTSGKKDTVSCLNVLGIQSIDMLIGAAGKKKSCLSMFTFKCLHCAAATPLVFTQKPDKWVSVWSIGDWFFCHVAGN